MSDEADGYKAPDFFREGRDEDARVFEFILENEDYSILIIAENVIQAIIDFEDTNPNLWRGDVKEIRRRDDLFLSQYMPYEGEGR